MNRIGLNYEEKQKVINDYLNKHNINKIKCFYFKKFKYEYDVNCEIEYIEYSDIEMYKFFYRLLEEIDENTLIIIDECMRTQNRNELIYNCAHHYLNQTKHRIIFEYLPFIEDTKDFMILMDFNKPNKYKTKSFEYDFLYAEDILVKPIIYKLNVINIGHTEKELQRYNKKRDSLFNNLGLKDPNTIPRNLQLVAGNLKKKIVEENKLYVARNKRFKLDNVVSYDYVAPNTKYIIIDFHFRRLNMNDYLKKTKSTDLQYISTGLSIDNVLIDEFNNWTRRLKEFYDKASIYR